MNSQGDLNRSTFTNQMCTDKDIGKYAKCLGVNLPTEEMLLPYVGELLRQKLPKNWTASRKLNGELEYSNSHLGKKLAFHPCRGQHYCVIQKERELQKAKTLTPKKQQQQLMEPIQVTNMNKPEPVYAMTLKQQTKTVVRTNTADDDELAHVASAVGIDMEKESQLMDVVRAAIAAPLVHPWIKALSSKGMYYYYNTSNEESSWDHPQLGLIRYQVEDARQKQLFQQESVNWSHSHFTGMFNDQVDTERDVSVGITRHEQESHLSVLRGSLDTEQIEEKSGKKAKEDEPANPDGFHGKSLEKHAKEEQGAEPRYVVIGGSVEHVEQRATGSRSEYKLHREDEHGNKSDKDNHDDGHFEQHKDNNSRTAAYAKEQTEDISNEAIQYLDEHDKNVGGIEIREISEQEDNHEREEACEDANKTNCEEDCQTSESYSEEDWENNEADTQHEEIANGMSLEQDDDVNEANGEEYQEASKASSEEDQMADIANGLRMIKEHHGDKAITEVQSAASEISTEDKQLTEEAKSEGDPETSEEKSTGNQEMSESNVEEELSSSINSGTEQVLNEAGLQESQETNSDEDRELNVANPEAEYGPIETSSVKDHQFGKENVQADVAPNGATVKIGAVPAQPVDDKKFHAGANGDKKVKVATAVDDRANQEDGKDMHRDAEEKAYELPNKDEDKILTKQKETVVRRNTADDDELAHVASAVGIDMEKESQLMDVVRAAIAAPLVHPWIKALSSKGMYYYYNTSNEESSWDHPQLGLIRYQVEDARQKQLFQQESVNWSHSHFTGMFNGQVDTERDISIGITNDEQRSHLSVLRGSLDTKQIEGKSGKNSKEDEPANLDGFHGESLEKHAKEGQGAEPRYLVIEGTIEHVEQQATGSFPENKSHREDDLENKSDKDNHDNGHIEQHKDYSSRIAADGKELKKKELTNEAINYLDEHDNYVGGNELRKQFEQERKHEREEAGEDANETNCEEDCQTSEVYSEEDWENDETSTQQKKFATGTSAEQDDDVNEANGEEYLEASKASSEEDQMADIANGLRMIKEHHGDEAVTEVQSAASEISTEGEQLREEAEPEEDPETSEAQPAGNQEMSESNVEEELSANQSALGEGQVVNEAIVKGELKTNGAALEGQEADAGEELKTNGAHSGKCQEANEVNSANGFGTSDANLQECQQANLQRYHGPNNVKSGKDYRANEASSEDDQEANEEKTEDLRSNEAVLEEVKGLRDENSQEEQRVKEEKREDNHGKNLGTDQVQNEAGLQKSQGTNSDEDRESNVVSPEVEYGLIKASPVKDYQFDQENVQVRAEANGANVGIGAIPAKTLADKKFHVGANGHKKAKAETSLDDRANQEAGKEVDSDAEQKAYELLSKDEDKVQTKQGDNFEIIEADQSDSRLTTDASICAIIDNEHKQAENEEEELGRTDERDSKEVHSEITGVFSFSPAPELLDSKQCFSQYLLHAGVTSSVTAAKDAATMTNPNDGCILKSLQDRLERMETMLLEIRTALTRLVKVPRSSQPYGFPRGIQVSTQQRLQHLHTTRKNVKYPYLDQRDVKLLTSQSQPSDRYERLRQEVLQEIYND